MKSIAILAAALLAAGSSQGAEIEVVEGNNMPVVKAKIDGVECLMLVDTGATHTTLDLSFAKERLGEERLQDVMLVGATNVKTAPKFVKAETLEVDGENIPVSGVMAIDLAHLPKAVRRPVAGILGMDHLTHAPFILSLGEGKLKWNPTDVERKGFVKVPSRLRGNSRELAAKLPSGKIVWLLADTGSTFTFLGEGLWRKGEGSVEMVAAGVNSAKGEKNSRGERGRIEFGPDFAVEAEPMLTGEKDLNQVGSDLFRRVDLLVDGEGISLRTRSSR